MAKYYIELARMVRETALVEVEADSSQAANAMMDKAYDDYEGYWTSDIEWGADAATHFCLGLVEKED